MDTDLDRWDLRMRVIRACTDLRQVAARDMDAAQTGDPLNDDAYEQALQQMTAAREQYRAAATTSD